MKVIDTNINNFNKLPKYNEVKAAQVAASLLKLRGGTMHYMKLIKLMYIIDRTALINWGRPVTFDHHVSMDNGPVLSKTYGIIRDEPEPNQSGVWNTYISQPKDYCVSLINNNPPCEKLSDAEIKLINKVFKDYGRMNRWELNELSHKFPEWQNPKNSMIPIDYTQILRAGNVDETEISLIVEELESVAEFESHL